jgi:hypothetical protein
MWSWLVRDWQWPAAAVFAGVFLLAVLPPFASAMGAALTLVYVQLPIYLLHQGEEHIGDRFRLHVNRTVAGGREALTPAGAFWGNALGVWVFNLVALYLAWAIAPSFGLAAGYLALVNVVFHLVPLVVQREYNPGLVTAVLLLLPAGGWCVVQVGYVAGLLPNAIGLLAAIAVHAALVGPILVRARLMRAAAPIAVSDQRGV